MAPGIGYLLPTREQVMEGQPESRPLPSSPSGPRGWGRFRSGLAIRCSRGRATNR